MEQIVATLPQGTNSGTYMLVVCQLAWFAPAGKTYKTRFVKVTKYEYDRYYGLTNLLQKNNWKLTSLIRSKSLRNTRGASPCWSSSNKVLDAPQMVYVFPLPVWLIK